MNKIKYFLIVFLGITCSCNEQNKDKQNYNSFQEPKTYPLGTKEKYLTNTLTGDTIKPIINSLGDTIKTGVRNAIEGRRINPESVEKPLTVKAGIPVITPVITNRSLIPEKLTVIQLDESKLAITIIGKKVESHVLTNSIGDTIPTGVRIPAKGKVVPFRQPKPTPALSFRMKDNAINSMQYLDVDQGLSSSNVRCVLEDKRGNIWMGTTDGVSKYDGKHFTLYKETEGLSNNYMSAMMEDKKGNLWFATEIGGVSKYDGKNFTQFSETEGLPKKHVYSILEDRKGVMWFGTNRGGVSRFDGESFTHYTVNEGLPNNMVRTIMEDKKGNIWFGTTGDGVCKYDGTSFTRYNESVGLSSNFILSMIEDKQGNIWFGTNIGVTRFDGKQFTHYSIAEGFPSNYVFSIFEDKSGKIWFATMGGGVIMYDPTEKRRTGSENFTHLTEKEGLSNNFVFSITEDKYGILWFGTSAGINKYDNRRFSHYTKEQGLSNETILGITEDVDGDIWFGTQGGITKFDGTNYIHFTQKEGLCNNNTYIVLEDKSGNHWIPTNGGASKYTEDKSGRNGSFTRYSQNTGLPYSVVMAVIQDRNGNIWFGTQGGVSMYDTISKQFTNYTEKDGLCNNNVWSVLEDKEGNLWFASYGGGVSKFEPATKEHSAFITHYTEAEGLPSNLVRSIFEDNKGALWFATNSGGLSKFDGKSFTNYSEKDGLINNNVRSVKEDKKGNLLVGTKKGMSYFVFEKEGNGPSLKIINILKDDGLKGTDFYQNASFIDSKNRFWNGTTKGLEVLDLNLFETSDVIPAIILKELEINSEFLDYRNLNDRVKNKITFDSVAPFENYPINLILPFDRNHLTFHFSAIDWSAAHKIKYQYKIDGLDNDWAPVTDKSEADYRNIPYGTHTFKVRAIGESQIWGDPLNYTFTVLPPWYHTLWFRLLLIVLFICLLYFLYRSRTAALRARQKQLENTVEERTEELKREKEIVEEKHKEITDSINYAERIQRSFLATKELLNENLNDHFVLFQPKDVVSGDFYWAGKLSNGNFVLATADSTGHGVPGAIMSILNISCLEKAVEEEKITEPNEILNHTRLNIIKRLKKDGSAEGGKDGMDCSLISFDFKNNKLTYAAANNPIWIAREDQLLEFAPDKMPVGKHDNDHISFTQHTIPIQKGDVVYTLTDGFPDQFGGPKGKKFMYRQLKELLISISAFPMDRQKQELLDALNNWKGNLEQIDDVALIGIRI